MRLAKVIPLFYFGCLLLQTSQASVMQHKQYAIAIVDPQLFSPADIQAIQLAEVNAETSGIGGTGNSNTRTGGIGGTGNGTTRTGGIGGTGNSKDPVDAPETRSELPDVTTIPSIPEIPDIPLDSVPEVELPDIIDGSFSTEIFDGNIPEP